MVTLVFDHGECYEDPHDHTFHVKVYRMPEYVAAVTFDTSLDATTSVDLSPGLYSVYGSAGWSPDGPSDSGWASNCGCGTAIADADGDVQLSAGETVRVTAPVDCGSTHPD